MSNPEVEEVGTITHYFPKINVAIVVLSKPLSVGDKILIKGPLTDFEMTVDSMQIEHKGIQRAETGLSIGLKLSQHARERDVVYKQL